MKIQLASDLHLENLARRFPGEALIRPANQADVMVLAGDIGHAADAIALFSKWPVPVLYVLGNHEAYNGCIDSVLDELKAASCGTSVRFLERELSTSGVSAFWVARCGQTTDCNAGSPNSNSWKTRSAASTTTGSSGP